MAGYPNITVPMGYVDELPVGISFFGRAWSEPLLLEMVYAYERDTKYRKSPKFLLSDEEKNKQIIKQGISIRIDKRILSADIS